MILLSDRFDTESMRKKLFYILLMVLTYSVGAHSSTVKFTQDAEVEDLTSRHKTAYKAGDSMDFSKESIYLIQMDKKAPMILVSANSGVQEVEVAGYPLADVVALNAQKEVDQVLSGIIAEINTIQNLARRQQFGLANQKLDDLQRRHPNVNSLSFLKASILYVSGKKSDAEFVLKEALKKYPNNTEGQKLLEEIQRK